MRRSCTPGDMVLCVVDQPQQRFPESKFVDQRAKFDVVFAHFILCDVLPHESTNSRVFCGIVGDGMGAMSGRAKSISPLEDRTRHHQ